MNPAAANLPAMASAIGVGAAGDRFVRSVDHGSMLHYALLHWTGYASRTIMDHHNFRQSHNLCPGHSESPKSGGFECKNAPLGRGLASINFGIDQFDASNYADQFYTGFGIDAEAIAAGTGVPMPIPAIQ